MKTHLQARMYLRAVGWRLWCVIHNFLEIGVYYRYILMGRCIDIYYYIRFQRYIDFISCLDG